MTSSIGDADPAKSTSPFDTWLDRFLSTVLRRFPVDATFLGEHGHDHVLPDYSPAADTAWSAQIGELIHTLDAIPADEPSKAQLYDRILARGALQLWQWETTAPCFQAGNPAHHTSEAIAGITALVGGTERPTGDRMTAAVARMRAIPAFLETAQRRMHAAPLVWTELAMKQADVATAYFGSGVQQLADRFGLEDSEFRQAAIGAAKVFATHASWLRAELAERRIPTPTAGTDALDRYLHLGHLLPIAQDPQWWFDYAHAELIEATAELRELAKAIDWRATSRVLLQRLAEIHPSPEGYDAAFPAAWERSRMVAIDAGLVTWPEQPVHFVSLAPWERELWQAIPFPVYRGAPSLEGRSAARAFYPVLDRSLSADAQERFLRHMNDTLILLDYAVRNAGLGLHVQSAYARNAPTRIGRLAGTFGATRRLFFCGNAVSDGWACYAVELMEEIGALTELQRLSEAQRRLRVAARAVGDIGIHTGELSLARVARMYRDEAGLTATQAMEQAVRDSMQPGVGMAELAGTAGIDELRRAIEDRNGARFDLRAFHDRFLSHGAIPVTLIAASMLEVANDS